MSATELYWSVIGEVRKQIKARGLPMWRCDELSGVQDGYTAKMLHPDTPSGRQAQWYTLQLLIDALYPSGFKVVIKPRITPRSKEGNLVVRWQQGSSIAGKEMLRRRHEKLLPERRRIIARNAARARWQRVRANSI